MRNNIVQLYKTVRAIHCCPEFRVAVHSDGSAAVLVGSADTLWSFAGG